MKTLKQHINYPRKQHGVTLVELMIAITISSIVMIGISSVYTSSKRSYKLQEEFSRLQENGRFAINHITRFVRSAGYSGCASGLTNMVNNLNDNTDDPWNFETGIEGYEYVGTVPGQLATLTDTPTPAPAGDLDKWKATTADTPLSATADLLGHTFSPVANTDILISRTADGSGVEVSEDNGGGQIFISDNGSHECADGTTGYSGLCKGDILVISDCQQSIIFQTTNIQVTSGRVNLVHANTNMDFYGGPGNANPDLDMLLKQGNEVMRISTKAFFVGKGANGPSLFMKQGNADAVELVEGVESMQVLYGVDDDANADNIPNRYVAANEVPNFADVVAVRVTILLRSVKELPWRTAAPKTHLLGGMDNDTAVRLTSPSDKRLRKVMSTTIKVRNRAFSY